MGDEWTLTLEDGSLTSGPRSVPDGASPEAPSINQSGYASLGHVAKHFQLGFL